MDYKYRCVVDAAGFYKTFVLVLPGNDQDGNSIEEVQYYTLAEGERLVDTSPPSTRSHAGAQGLVLPRWDGAAWTEGATPEEITTWEREHPAPEPPGPDRLATAETQITDLQLALAEAYEYADAQNTNTMLALTEVYEAVLAQGGGEPTNG